MKKHNVTAIILAGGIGSRMKADKAKQYIDILGKTVIERSVFAFDSADAVTDIVVVVRDGDLKNVSSLLRSKVTKPIKVVAGGKSRAESAINGFLAIDDETEFVAIHDAARCLITPTMINKVVNEAKEYGAATAACTISDTLKLIDDCGKIVKFSLLE